jgi:hypothetical protein
MRLDRSILFAVTASVAATTGTAFGQTNTENPPSTPPEAQVMPAPPAPVMQPAPPPPVMQPPPPPPVMQPPPPAPVMQPPPPAPVMQPVYYARPPDVVPVPSPVTWTPSSGIGVGLFVGGGVTDFTEGGTRSQTNAGGSWTGRITFGTRSIVAFEGSYIGGENALTGLGARSSTLIRNGLEGSLRLNLPIYAQGTLLEPYAMGGLGWNSYHIVDYSSASLASLSSGTDNTVTIPLGVGLTIGYRGFLADVRYTYRPTYEQEIFINQVDSGLTNWDLGGMVGYEF